jgi:hypothetical protein
MRLSWAQAVAGGLTCAVVAGLLLLPSRLLGPDRPAAVPVPQAGQARSVQAVPPRAIRPRKRPKAPAPAPVAPRRYTYAAAPRVVVRASPARKMLKTHRAAVIRRLAPSAPLHRARVLTAAVPRPAAKPVSSTAETIAALAASLGKK